MESVEQRFTRSSGVKVIGSPVIYRDKSGRFEWHIYKIAGEDQYALISMGLKRPGVRPGIHGIFTGGSQSEYESYIKSLPYGYTKRG